MGKVDYRKLSPKQYESLHDEVQRTLSALGLRSDGLALLLGLLTESEVVMFARRIQIARKLLRGESVKTISDTLRVGEDTVHSVDRWLSKTFPDYRNTLKRIPGERRERNGKPPEPYSFRWLHKHYHRHWAILDLFLGEP